MSATSCTVRPLGEADLNDLMAIKPEEGLHHERFRDQAEGLIRYLGAEVTGRIVGFVVVMLGNKADVMPHTGGEPCCDMVDLLVLESQRGQGIGSRLATGAEDACRALGVHWLGLDVNPTDNAPAQRLYQKLGYAVVGPLHLDGTYPTILPDGSAGVYEDWCVDMVKRLD